MKKKLGDANDPLLVSVRSGAAASMPGMMDTILNLGSMTSLFLVWQKILAIPALLGILTAG